jgi:ferredoxin-NADP reductase
MITAVSDALHDLGMPMDHVVYERFDYSGGAAPRARTGGAPAWFASRSASASVWRWRRSR